jgi:hypothetical protein
MKLEQAIESIFALVGVDDKYVPAVADIFRAAGVPESVPDGKLKKVLQAGKKLKALGIK